MFHACARERAEVLALESGEYRYEKNDCLVPPSLPEPPAPRQTARQRGLTALSQNWPGLEALLIVLRHLRCGLAHFKLGAHFLQARSKRFYLFLLVPDNRLEVLLLLRKACLQFLRFAVHFEKLVKQRRARNRNVKKRHFTY
jgi:hypothetical protein